MTTLLLYIKTRLLQPSTFAGLAGIAGAIAQYGFAKEAIVPAILGSGLVHLDESRGA